MTDADYDIAGICAHPDDAELVMGGTLARETARGRRVALVDLTRGESGSRGTPEIRAREAAEAARILGIQHRESLGLPDAALSNVTEQKDPLVAAIRRLRPRVVILPHWEQRHPDHRTASHLVYDACFLAGLRNYRPDLGAAFRPHNLLYALAVADPVEVTPTVVVDITPFWKVKQDAILAFQSQFQPAPGTAEGSIPLALDRFREAVELHARRQGQRIRVAYGEGFIIKEPISLDDPLPSDRIFVLGRYIYGGRITRILVAEDDPDTRDFLCLMLQKSGHDVHSRPDGEMAWQALKREHTPLLLVDCMMPRMDGFKLCRHVRKVEGRYTYVIMLTAYGGRTNYLKGMDAGADDFLTKPCDFEELRARIRVAERVLGLQEEVRQLRGLLPICTYCKKVREDEQEWVPVEIYVARRSDASFSHGICPECFTDRVQPELQRLKRS